MRMVIGMAGNFIPCSDRLLQQFRMGVCELSGHEKRGNHIVLLQYKQQFPEDLWRDSRKLSVKTEQDALLFRRVVEYKWNQ